MDVGCGSGRFMSLLGKSVKYYHGLDISSEALKIAGTMFEEKNTRIEKGDVTKLPFKNNTFDKVICIDVLEHIVDDITVLKEIRRILKSDGKAIIFFVDNFSSNKFFRKHFIGEEDVGHIHIYNKNIIIKKLKEANLKIEMIISYRTLLDYLLNLVRRKTKPRIISPQVMKFDKIYKLIAYLTFIEKYFSFIQNLATCARLQNYNSLTTYNN